MIPRYLFTQVCILHNTKQEPTNIIIYYFNTKYYIYNYINIYSKQDWEIIIPIFTQSHAGIRKIILDIEQIRPVCTRKL